MTIFIPTYNRGYIIEKALQSIEASSNRNLEVLVVDDGSSDDTEARIEAWARQSRLDIRYLRQSNQGKHVAHNLAVDHARGELFLNLDSDDELLPDAVDNLLSSWDELPESRKGEFAGIEGLCLNDDGSLSGSELPRDRIESDFLSIRNLAKRNGEKRAALRLDVLKNYKYPVFENERHMRPAFILNRMAHRYKTLFTNHRIIRVGHQPDGICFNRRKIQLQCPLGYRQYFLEEVRDHYRYNNTKALFDHYARYIRYSLHGGIGFFRQFREIPNRWLWLLALPKGCLDWFRDRWRSG
jgi:glycosyltransferase involved in cell wall biosynthesis